MGFDPGLKLPTCVATLKSWDRTKQSVCGWQYIRSSMDVEPELILLHTIKWFQGGACGVMVIVVGNGHGDTSSNSGRDWLHFS